MSQQSKRRRKRYQPGSAYAGHVRPRGVFGVFSNVRLFMIIGIVIMVGSLGIGGLFQAGLFGGGSNAQPNTFVKPGDKDKTPATEAPAEIRQYATAPPMSIDPTKRYLITVKTDLGDIQAELFADQVPQTVNNFVFLAKDRFYDGLTFFVTNLSAQAGDPTNEWRSASEDAGYELAQEKPGAFQEGTLGMVNSSQFFIALDQSDTFAAFTPFGRVTQGLDIARQITRGTAIRSIDVQEAS
jgi:cyclophilin family peptidyl-prolyl cis-trans isomerase